MVNRSGWTVDDVPAILIRNSASEQGHRAPDPWWLKALMFVGLLAGTGVAVAAGVMVAWLAMTT